MPTITQLGTVSNTDAVKVRMTIEVTAKLEASTHTPNGVYVTVAGRFLGLVAERTESLLPDMGKWDVTVPGQRTHSVETIRYASRDTAVAALVRWAIRNGKVTLVS